MAVILMVGGVEHTIPEMNFIAVERAWPYVEQAMATVDPIAGTNSAIAVIAACLIEDEAFDASYWGIDPLQPLGEGAVANAPQLKKDLNAVHAELINVLRRRLKAKEVGAVKLCMFEILAEAGFEIGEPGSGEDQAPVEEASLSPEIAADTLQSSSPLDAKEEAGTA